MKPVEIAAKREQHLIQGLHDLANKYGKEIFPINTIDSNGEVTFAIEKPGSYRHDKDRPCGQFGQELSDLLNQVQVRTGLTAKKGFVTPENGWVRINHFEVEKLLDIAEKQSADQENSEANNNNEDNSLRM